MKNQLLNLVSQGYTVSLSESRYVNGGTLIQLSKDKNFSDEYNSLVNTDPAKLEQDIETCKCELDVIIKSRHP